MLIKSLVQYAKRNGISSENYKRKFHAAIIISPQGKFRGVQPFEEGRILKALKNPIGKTGSSTNCDFCYEKGSKIFKSLIKKKPKQMKIALAKLEGFRKQIREAHSATKSKAAKALLKFLENCDSNREFERKVVKDLQNIKHQNHGDMWICFNIGKKNKSGFYECLDSNYVHNDSSLREYWASVIEKHRKAKSNIQKVNCPGCGKLKEPVRKHPHVETPFGRRALISCNQTNVNFLNMPSQTALFSGICSDCADSYVAALENLMSNKQNCYRYQKPGNIDSPKYIFIWWSNDHEIEKEVRDLFLAALDSLGEAPEEEKAEDVKRHVSSIHTGRDTDFDDTMYHAILVKIPEKGQITIMRWIDTTAADMRRRIKQWKDDLRHSKNINTPTIRGIIKALTPRPDKEPLSTTTDLISCAIFGEQIPFEMADRALSRYPNHCRRSGNKWNRLAATSIMKAYLIRNQRGKIKMSLDRENKDQAYLLGRIFAIFATAQMAASRGTVSRTITDRKIDEYIDNPCGIFHELVSSFQNHLKKLKTSDRHEEAATLDKEYHNISSDLKPIEETHLRPIDKYNLCLGHLHQENDLWGIRKNYTESKNGEKTHA